MGIIPGFLLCILIGGLAYYLHERAGSDNPETQAAIKVVTIILVVMIAIIVMITIIINNTLDILESINLPL